VFFGAISSETLAAAPEPQHASIAANILTLCMKKPQPYF
jgi:hypothetical protein